MYSLLIILFIIGYVFIALEHPLKVNKTAFAIITGVLCWVIVISSSGTFMSAITNEVSPANILQNRLTAHLGEICEILFFLLGAMTIVELIDVHDGFSIITSKIKTTDKKKLLWILSLITFFLSALLDNLTTAIVMATLLKKIIKDKRDLCFFGGIIIIAANAGGAWSPIGDVTTIMLWIRGQVSAINIIVNLFIPSVLCVLSPLLIASIWIKGNLGTISLGARTKDTPEVTNKEQKIVFWWGILSLLAVPVFKAITHLPPFMGMLFFMGIMWVITELLHRRKENDLKSKLTISGVINKIDTPSIIFFLGILLAVAGLQTAGVLKDLALLLGNTFKNIFMLNTLIGLMSSIVDNVPLVAGAIGMYPLDQYPQDHLFWQLLSFCAGTGGSVLIIGSAAGVAIMGILKIDFIWYFKKISWLALIGYLTGMLYLYIINL